MNGNANPRQVTPTTIEAPPAAPSPLPAPPEQTQGDVEGQENSGLDSTFERSPLDPGFEVVHFDFGISPSVTVQS